MPERGIIMVCIARQPAGLYAPYTAGAWHTIGECVCPTCTGSEPEPYARAGLYAPYANTTEAMFYIDDDGNVMFEEAPQPMDLGTKLLVIGTLIGTALFAYQVLGLAKRGTRHKSH